MRKLLLPIGLLLSAAIAIAYFTWPRPQPIAVDYKMPGNPLPKIQAAAAAAIERRERIIDQTIWAKEIQAQEHGRIFEDYWDQIKAATNKLEAASRFYFDNLLLGAFDSTNHFLHQISTLTSTKPGRTLRGLEWPALLESFSSSGWRLQQLEFRHNAFDPQTNATPARSRFYFTAHLTNASPAHAAIEGDLLVEWKTNSHEIAHIDATQLHLQLRPGPPAFTEILHAASDKPNLSETIDPLNVFDLDGDGVPEIIFPALNLLYRRIDGLYKPESLFTEPKLQVSNGLFADFDNDGVTDFLYINPDGVFLLKGAPGGKFTTPSESVYQPPAYFQSPYALTAGDIDGDGDLDIFIGEYRGPFISGNMPTPYYDANDGYPFFLLINDGHGHFRDATAEAGLTAKRQRRVYGCSFVDLDGDGFLDLIVTSDFAGVDVYRNDDKGHFTDMTETWLNESHLFGMAHTFGDFNNDGRLDFFAAGMTSPTAERLEHLHLTRPFSKYAPAQRARIIQGSRLYLSFGNNFIDQAAPFHVARTGWSWGSAAADFDNDGWLDLYVANGMESKSTVRDYDSEFWLHDIFVGDSKGDPNRHAYFSIKGGATRGQGMSYGGFDKNRLFLNQSGRDFLEAAPLLGVALESDCRNLVATDLDGDGKIDFILTSIESVPPYKQRIRFFRNDLPDTGNWIAFRFDSRAIGTRVLLESGDSKRVATVVSGESFRSQRPLEVHFGLGTETNITALEITWPGGAKQRLTGPELNRAHFLSAPKKP